MNEKDADWLKEELAAATESTESWNSGLKATYETWLAADSTDRK